MKKSLWGGMATVLCLVLLWTSDARAIDPIPEESGFRGFLDLGYGIANWKTNMVAGNRFSEIGDRRIDSLGDSPDSNWESGPLINLRLSYTFAETRTQLFYGNSLEDFLRFEQTSQIGVNQEVGSLGTLGAGFVFNLIPTEVWKDPYLLDRNRARTTSRSNGGRLTWDDIFGSDFQVQYTYRDISIGDEDSGVNSDLSQSERNRLRREGDWHEFEALYTFNFGESLKQYLVPSFRYSLFDLDGDAMSNDTYDFQLSYGLNQERWALVLNGLLGRAEYDKSNPLFDRTREDDRYGGGVTVFYRKPFGWEIPWFRGWSLRGSAGYFRGDSNIDFYDTEVTAGSLSAFFSF